MKTLINKDKKKILFYYMRGIVEGGSDHSLYYHIINLNEKDYKPIVLYRNKSELLNLLLQKNILLIKHKYFALIHPKTHKKLFHSIFYNKTPGIKSVIYFLRSFIEIFLLIVIIIKYRIDILHLNHSIKSDRTAAIAGLLTGRKVIVHNRMWINIKRFDLFLLKRVSKIICISDFQRNQFKNYRLDLTKIVTIHNGLDTNIFYPKSKARSEKIKIGFVGRLEKWKGIYIFLEAAELVNRKFNDIEFLIAGSGPERKNIEKLINENLNTKNILLLGIVNNMHEIYNQFDVFIHSSIKPEPFGRVVIEAMACGLPVISTNIGGPKEIISDGIDGYLIEPGDPKILAEKIIFLIENQDIRKKLGKTAIETVKNRFNILETTRKIENVYSNI